MKLKEYQYQRTNVKDFEAKFTKLLDDFDSASNLEEQNQVFCSINQLRNEFKAMQVLAFIRHSQDVTDEYYQQENDFMTKVSTTYQGFVSKFKKLLAKAKYRSELESIWGEHLFNLADETMNTYSDDVAELLQKESEMANQYMGIIATSKVHLQGQERNIMELMPFMENKDRAIRKEAHLAFSKLLEMNEAKLDKLFDELVKLRHEIAQKLGYANYLGLGYARLNRIDYTPDMVEKFRDQIQQHVVPVLLKLRDRQARRLGLDKLMYYDEDLNFLTGNPNPVGGPEDILATSQQMYQEMSKESGEFFNYMLEKGLLDVLDRDNKAKMGYCTYIPKYKSPFVFSNFNGTSYDVVVVTHEAGHAFQSFCCRDFQVPEYIDATAEVSEIHSMTMELMVWPWLNQFFGEGTEKFKFSALDNTFSQISLVAIGDEFQDWVYKNPEATPEKRKAVWREIEKKYWPHKDYGDNEFFNRGGYWYRFLHFFQAPLYMIDYGLAQFCAYQFFVKSLDDWDGAWRDYIALCKAGGSKSFLNVIKEANLTSPFVEGNVEATIKPIEAWLDKVDDSKF